MNYSVSPWASPIVLARKKDKTWGFAWATGCLTAWPMRMHICCQLFMLIRSKWVKKNNLKTGYDSFIADKSTGREQHSQLVICCGNMQWCHLYFAMHLWPLDDWQTYFWEHTITTFDNFIAHVATLDVEDVKLSAVLKLNL